MTFIPSFLLSIFADSPSKQEEKPCSSSSIATVTHSNLELWEEFLKENPKVEFVWLQIMSYTSMTFIRMVPVTRFTQMMKAKQLFSLPKAAFSLTPGDHLAEGASPSGAFYLNPDSSTAHCQAGSNGTRAVIQCSCLNTGLASLAECPRSQLQIVHESLQNEMKLSVLVGFEIEIVFLKMDGKAYAPINENQSWACVSADDFAYIELIENIVRALAEVGIFLEHFHSESAPGQWEFVLPPRAPVEAADALLKARDTIKNIARSYEVHPTIYPRLSQKHAGSGSHVHISVNPQAGEESQNPESFFAGVLDHMPSVLAFTLPQDISYDRVQAGLWSGGEYACWGWENKEVILRRIENNRFELKLMDGFANPYLALGAIIAAGMDGLANKKPLRGGDCRKSPNDMTSVEREALGVKDLLPKTLDESLAALQSDEEIHRSLGETLVRTYVAVKKTETQYLRNMTDEERKLWLISRY